MKRKYYVYVGEWLDHDAHVIHPPILARTYCNFDSDYECGSMDNPVSKDKATVFYSVAKAGTALEKLIKSMIERFPEYKDRREFFPDCFHIEELKIKPIKQMAI